MKRSDLPQFSELRLGAEFYVPVGVGAVSPKTPKLGPYTKMSASSYIASPTAMSPAGGHAYPATAATYVWPAGTSRDVAEIKRERNKRDRAASSAKSDGQKRGERRYRDAKARLREKLGREPTSFEMARDMQRRMLARKPGGGPRGAS